MKDYLQDILDTVFSSFSSQQVRIENRVAPLSVRTRSAVPVGLIINEIATNAIKHGFRADEQACFTVEMGLNEEESAYCLTVGNSGNPFPEEIDLDSPQSLGMQLITTLVAQLGGTVELRKRPSPLFTIRFPVDEQ
jgi:two-component sensor histidine kinase